MPHHSGIGLSNDLMSNRRQTTHYMHPMMALSFVNEIWPWLTSWAFSQGMSWTGLWSKELGFPLKVRHTDRGNAFHITGRLWGESVNSGFGFPPQKTSNARLWCCFLVVSLIRLLNTEAIELLHGDFDVMTLMWRHRNAVSFWDVRDRDNVVGKEWPGTFH